MYKNTSTFLNQKVHQWLKEGHIPWSMKQSTLASLSCVTARQSWKTNLPATWSHPDLSETVTQWQNNGAEMGSHLRANPKYMHHTQFVNVKNYNLMPNSKQPGNGQYSLPVPIQSENTYKSTPSTQQSASLNWPTLCQHLHCPQQWYIPFSMPHKWHFTTVSIYQKH